MSIPGPVVTGTIVFLILAASLLALNLGAMVTGMLSKDNAGIGNVVIIVCTVSTWLFWLCAWLHQWHPLIKPIYEAEE